MAAEELRRAVHDDVRAQLERTLQHRAREGAVDRHQRARRRARSRSTASRSTTRSSGLVGDSSQTRRVRSVIAAAIASGSVGSTAVKRQPVALEHLVEEPEGAAVDVLGEDDVVAGFEEQHAASVVAARPDANARQCAAPSSDARHSSRLARVGLPEREYSNPRCRPGDSCANVVARWIGSHHRAGRRDRVPGRRAARAWPDRAACAACRSTATAVGDELEQVAAGDHARPARRPRRSSARARRRAAPRMPPRSAHRRPLARTVGPSRSTPTW